MDEVALLQCREEEKTWRCPVESCCEVLSRKQTLQSHLSTRHDITAGNRPKRYKLYEYDQNAPVPKSTEHERSRTLSVDVTEPRIAEDDIAETYEEMNPGVSNLNVEDMVVESPDPKTSPQPSLSDTFASDAASPLYIIPPSSEVYKSKISKFDHVMSLCALATRHNLSDKVLKDIVTLLQMHIPEKNVGVTDIKDLKGICGFDKDYLKYHTYCEYCKKIFNDDVDECQTPDCDGRKSDIDSTRYFVTSDLSQQVKEILERKGLWDKVRSLPDTSSSTVISDIRSSSGYKEMLKPGGFLNVGHNITLTLFIDGVPLFKSSCVSMWPVYLLVNEIPPRERFLRKNMLLWGIWQGAGKPKMSMFLTPLVTDLVELYNKGVQICVDGQVYQCRAKLIIATMDLQARAYVTNMTQHNGEYSCLFCMEPGMVVKSGSGNCRSFPSRPLQLRDDQMVVEAAKTASEDGKRCLGFFGESVLNFIPYFSLTENVVIDYMHGTLLGITKKLLDLWFNSKNASTPHYIGPKISAVDQLMKNIHPPYVIHRSPRILSNTYGHWKASELRNWLLFYSIPCLQGILPDVYLKHYSCLVESTYIMLSEGINADDLNRADTLLQLFVRNVEPLYGQHIMSLNVHNLLHLVHFVRIWGPLWGYSCFPFESFNGEMKQAIHGTGNVCRQIFWSFQAQKRIAHILSTMPDGLSKDFISGLESVQKHRKTMDGYQCSIVKL